jgi:type II secretory pathway predicted ATPase ExeA
VTSESPFSPVWSRAAFVETVEGGEVLRRLDAGLGAREPFLLLTGESGTGKTTLVREAIARWDSRVTVALLAYPGSTVMELLEEIVLRFGGEPADGASRPRLMACLERSLMEVAGRGQTAMIVVDDAQQLPALCLDELRLLVNAVQQSRLPLEVLLVGSPELGTLIEDPMLAAVRERLSVRAKLGPLSPGETRRYLRHRTSIVGNDGATLFPRKICLEVAELTGGVPRRINTLAGEALRIASDAGEPTIRVDHLRAATEQLAGTMPARAADEPEDEESARSSDSTDALPDAQATAPIIALESSAARSALSTPSVVDRAAHPGRGGSATPRTEDSPPEEVDLPAPPASHDPGEWVSRFVGDQGPIRIGSQLTAISTWAAESEGAADRPSIDTARPHFGDETPPVSPSAGRSSPRSSNVNRLQVAIGAVAAIAIVVVIALITRAGYLTTGDHPRMVADDTSTVSGPSVVAASKPRRFAVITGVSSTAPIDGGRRADPVIESPTRRYTVAVGELSDLQAAFDERDRIRELTGIDTWVVPATDDAEPHRIVLGVYRSQERAKAVAKMLLDSRTLDSATVAPLPRRSVRQ